MKEKSIKTRQGCFALLTELILVLPGALAPHLDQIIPGIQFSLGKWHQQYIILLISFKNLDSYIKCSSFEHHRVLMIILYPRQ